jgi:hypothetical protein
VRLATVTWLHCSVCNERGCKRRATTTLYTLHVCNATVLAHGTMKCGWGGGRWIGCDPTTHGVRWGSQVLGDTRGDQGRAPRT